MFENITFIIYNTYKRTFTSVLLLLFVQVLLVLLAAILTPTLSLHIPTPVSYTHLDVYKRQI